LRLCVGARAKQSGMANHHPQTVITRTMEAAIIFNRLSNFEEQSLIRHSSFSIICWDLLLPWASRPPTPRQSRTACFGPLFRRHAVLPRPVKGNRTQTLQTPIHRVRFRVLVVSYVQENVMRTECAAAEKKHCFSVTTRLLSSTNTRPNTHQISSIPTNMGPLQQHNGNYLLI
jgi:hypothetical protein